MTPQRRTWTFLLCCCFAPCLPCLVAQQETVAPSPATPSLVADSVMTREWPTPAPESSSPAPESFLPAPDELPDAPMPTEVPAQANGVAGQTAQPAGNDKSQGPIGPDGKPIRPQTGRIFGIFPNFVAISGGTKPKPAGWKTDFHLANKQAYDYSSFGFLLLSSGLAYAQDSHPSLSTVGGGDAPFWAYLWRGFLDKTDSTYQGTFLFPALLHEDTRYYALGTGPVKKRLLHAVASVVVAHDYNQKPIFNLAGQLGRAGAQAVSTTYYPAGSESFGVLAEKFAYANMRNVIYAVVREFSPDAQAVVHSRHVRKAAKDAAAAKQGE